jgi:hypothetical protein
MSRVSNRNKMRQWISRNEGLVALAIFIPVLIFTLAIWITLAIGISQTKVEAVSATQVWYTDFVQCEAGQPGCGIPSWTPRIALTLAAMGEPYEMTKLFDCDCEDHIMALVTITAERDVLQELNRSTHARVDTDLTDAMTEIASKPNHAGIRSYMQVVYNRWQAQGCSLPADPVELMLQAPVCP